MSESSALRERRDARIENSKAKKREASNATFVTLKNDLKGKRKNQITQKHRNDFIDAMMADKFSISD